VVAGGLGGHVQVWFVTPRAEGGGSHARATGSGVA